MIINYLLELRKKCGLGCDIFSCLLRDWNSLHMFAKRLKFITPKISRTAEQKLEEGLIVKRGQLSLSDFDEPNWKACLQDYRIWHMKIFIKQNSLFSNLAVVGKCSLILINQNSRAVIELVPTFFLHDKHVSWASSYLAVSSRRK